MTAETNLAWSTSFACESDRERTTSVVTSIQAGGCDDGAAMLFESTHARGKQDRKRPPTLSPGRYGFSARALDNDGVTLARGCTEKNLPDRGVVQVKLLSLSDCAVTNSQQVASVHVTNNLCRFDPDCGGGVGGLCNSDADCDTNFCCTEEKNCGGGMCTYECKEDSDCPADMACEHKVCFFRCENHDECADGQSCEHDFTVCEWD